MTRGGGGALRRVVLAAMLCLSAALPSAARAQDAANGRVVEVSRDVRLERDGRVQAVTAGTAVLVGDVIRSGAGARAQIEFSEGTKIALGPNSVLRIDEILLRRNGTARKFAVSAVGGAFRFISGDSPERAYAIRTPSATMGIRGTAFDIAVGNTATTGLLVFEGRVLFCGAGRNCLRVPGGCNLLTVNSDSAFGAPADLADKTARIADDFPFVRGQDGLLPPFRTGSQGCDEDNTFRLDANLAVPRPPLDGGEIAPPAPAPEPPPEPEPPDFNPAD